jgi:hypothetical protein
MNFKNIYVYILLSIPILSDSGNAAAQNSPNELVIGGGVGFSLAPLLVDVATALNATNYTNNYGYTYTYTNSSIPVIGGTIDYGVLKELAIGGGISYQSFTVNLINYPNPNTGTYENITENISKLNIRLRVTAHWDFSSSHLWEFYGGAGIGNSIWSDKNSFNNPNLPDDAPFSSGSHISLQGFVGIRGYFTQEFGFHIELAVGSPYFIETGLNLRFGGMPLDKRGANH